MEPISYMIMLGNFTAGFAYYTMRKRDLELANLYQTLTNRIHNKMMKKNGIDIEDYRRVEAEIHELQA
jgi:hypothetical protein